ncbi:MAG: ATP-grasp domain-containing protein, partial [Dehalococcoidia bacterium]
LHLPGPGVLGARVATSKAMMREVFSQHGIPSPMARCCASLTEAEAAIRALGLPVVVKPTDNAGSRGVTYIDHPSQLAHAVEHALAHSKEQRLMVEEYVPGVEMSVEGFVVKGRFSAIALSDKIRTRPPYLLDTTVLFPSEQPKEVQEIARDLVRKSVEAAGLDTATIHAELKVGPDGGVKMIEFAARGAGFKVFTDMLLWVTGIDVVVALVRLAVGQPVDLSSPLARGSVLRFPDVAPGKVLRIQGVEEARAVPGVKELELYVQPGDQVPVLTSGSDRVGYFITVGESRREAERVMEQVEKMLCIEVAP